MRTNGRGRLSDRAANPLDPTRKPLGRPAGVGAVQRRSRLPRLKVNLAGAVAEAVAPVVEAAALPWLRWRKHRQAPRAATWR